MLRDTSGKNLDGNMLYAEFKRKYDMNKEAFDKVVSNFDENGVSLNTAKNDISNTDAETAKKNVDSMAKRASSKLLNK